MSLAVSPTRLALRSAGGARRQVNEAVRRVNATYPQAWLVNFLPRHFTNAATRRYGYAPRAGEKGSGKRWKGSYTQRKLRKFHHTRPLEATGEGVASVKSSRRATATTRRATATMRGSVFNFPAPRGGKHRLMRHEIETVLDSEQQQLERLAQKKSDSELRRAARRL